MCMSSGHGLMGAWGGYTTCMAITATTGHEWSWWFPHVAAGVVAGWALWPDIDTLKATVTTSLGFITRTLHEAVCWTCAGVYYATRTEADAPQPRIHRGLTHTWPGALFMGLLVTALCLLYPLPAVTVVLGISLHWGLRGLAIPRNAHGEPKGSAPARFATKRVYTALRLVPMPGRIFNWALRKTSRWMGFSGKWVRTSAVLVCTLAAWAMARQTPEIHQTLYILFLGALVTEGCLIHMLGDSITESGICWKFPFIDKATGKRWVETKIPEIHWRSKAYKPAFKTGRFFELGILYPVLIFGCIAVAPGGWTLLAFADQLATAWRHARVTASALALPAWPMTTRAATPPAQ